MTSKEIKNLLFNSFKNEFDVDDFFDQHGDNTQPFDFSCAIHYPSKDNELNHVANMEVVGAIYMNTGQTAYQNPLGYGVSEDVSEPNSINDWDILSVSIYIDGKDITKTEDLQTLGKLLS